MAFCRTEDVVYCKAPLRAQPIEVDEDQVPLAATVRPTIRLIFVVVRMVLVTANSGI